MATRAEVKAFGKLLKAGDTVVNRFQEHRHEPFTRQLVVVQDVPRLPFFILLEAGTTKTTWMRTRTLLERYKLVVS